MNQNISADGTLAWVREGLTTITWGEGGGIGRVGRAEGAIGHALLGILRS